MTAPTPTSPILDTLDRITNVLLDPRAARQMLWPGSRKLSHRERLLLRWDILSATLRSPKRVAVRVSASEDGVWVSLAHRPKARTERLSMPPPVAKRLASAPVEKLPQEILAARCDGWPLRDIAEVLGVSRQWAHVLLRRAPGHESADFPARPTVRVLDDSGPAAGARLSTLVSQVGGPHVVRDLIERYTALPEMVRYERVRASSDARKVRAFWHDVARLLSESGASVYTLSTAMGLSKSTLRNGLDRYGLIPREKTRRV